MRLGTMASITRSDLLKRMHTIFLVDPRSLRSIAPNIDISYQSLNQIWSGKRGAKLCTWYKIERWIISEEKRLDIK
jgi:hypothetical protein